MSGRPDSGPESSGSPAVVSDTVFCFMMGDKRMRHKQAASGEGAAVMKVFRGIYSELKESL